MKKSSLGASETFLEVNFSVEKWAKTFVFDAILKLKTDEERSLGAPIFFLEVNFSVEKWHSNFCFRPGLVVTVQV